MPQLDPLSFTSVPQMLHQRSNDSSIAHRVKRLGLWQAISFAEYAANVHALAHQLISLGVQARDHVALIGENRPEWLEADLAIQMVGAATVGIYATSSAEQLQYVLEHSDSVGIILEDAEQLEKFLLIKPNVPQIRFAIIMDKEHLEDVLIWEDMLAEGHVQYQQDPGPVHERLEAIQKDDTALLIYTSGTTGHPKGVMLSHYNLLWTVKAFREANSTYDSDELLSFLPLSHIVERVISVVSPLAQGYTVSFTENLDTVLQNMQEIRPTLFFAVPRIWEKFYSLIELHMKDANFFKRLSYQWSMRAVRGSSAAQQALAQLAVVGFLKRRLGIDRMRIAISGAAPISPDILGYFHSLGVAIREGYGMTENCGLTSIHRDEIKLGTVGPPYEGIEVKIAYDGEILMQGPCVFQGYYKNPEATAETLIDGWLHTGDIGELDVDGHLKITDRKKDIIITAGGKNIAPQKIENKLKTSIFINDAVVIGDRRKYLVALLVLDEDNISKWAIDQRISYSTYSDLAGNEAVRKLIEVEVHHVNKDLAQVETIKKFAILPKRLHHEDGEVTATLKVKRSSIAKKYATLIESLY